METMATKNLEFLLYEADSGHSRDGVVIDGGSGALASGTVLAPLANTAAAATASAIDGTGNATISAVVVSLEAHPGANLLTAATATTLTLYSPSGTELGVATAGTAATIGGLTFTVTAGSTAMVAGDTFTITVTHSAINADQYDATTDTAVAGILMYATDATDGDRLATAITRDADVVASLLVWKAATTKAQKDAAIVLLRAKGIIAR